MLALLLSSGDAEEWWCRSLGVDQGLSKGFVTTIAQERDRFLWLGPPDRLNRWDSYAFKSVFRHAGDNRPVGHGRLPLRLAGNADFPVGTTARE